MPATIAAMGTPSLHCLNKDRRSLLRRSSRIAAVALLGTVLLVGTKAGEIHSGNQTMEERGRMFEASTVKTAKKRRKSVRGTPTTSSASSQFFASAEKLSLLAQTEQEREGVGNYSKEGSSIGNMVEPHGLLRRTERDDEQAKQADNAASDSREFPNTHRQVQETPVEQSSSSTDGAVIVLVLVSIALILCMAVAMVLRHIFSEFKTSEIKMKGDFFGWGDDGTPAKTKPTEHKFDDENSRTSSCSHDDGSSANLYDDCARGCDGGEPARRAEGEQQETSRTTSPVDAVVGTGRLIGANHLPHNREDGTKEPSYTSSVYKCSASDGTGQENIVRGGRHRRDITVCNNGGDNEWISVAESQTSVSSLQSFQSARQYYLDKIMELLGEKRFRQISRQAGASRGCSSSNISSLPNHIEKIEVKLATMAVTSSRSRSRQRTIPIVCEDGEEHTESSETPQSNEDDICVHRSEQGQTAPPLGRKATADENWPRQLLSVAVATRTKKQRTHP